MSGTGLRTLGEVPDGLLDPQGGPGRIGGLSGNSGTGWRTLGEVRNVRCTLEEVRDGSGDLRGGP